MTRTSMATTKEVIWNQREQYIKSSKKEKGVILDSICLSTGLSRDRAARLLSVAPWRKSGLNKRGRKSKYDSDTTAALVKIWQAMDCPCGSRLVAGIKDMIDALVRFNEMSFRPGTISLLLEMSAATANRIIKIARKRFGYRGISTTKPGTLLKNQIPVRMGNQWDENRPGYLEIDLVAHCGSATAGDYVNTLDATDVNTGWTETRAVLNKAQAHVFAALMHIKENLPFSLKGIDSDNGSEFINNYLYRYCVENRICFTRSRSYKKNDNCHVEEKNWHIVRRHIGYERYEGKRAVEVMNQYYDVLRLYTNFFLPQTKLIEKYRDGARIRKRYEKPSTPYQRLLQSDKITEQAKEKLKEIYLTLNPVQLKNHMVELQNKLLTMRIPNV